MRTRLIVPIIFFALGGCGSSKDEADPSYDVARVSATSITCFKTLGDCTVMINGSFSDGNSYPPSGYDFVLSTVEAAEPPAQCDASSITGSMGYHQFTDRKLATSYAVRACLFSRTAKTYSAGAVTTFTTPES